MGIMLAMAGMAKSVSSESKPVVNIYDDLVDIELNDKAKKINDAYDKAVQDSIKRNKGLSLFNINGKEVWALNRKNAERKAKKL